MKRLTVLILIFSTLLLSSCSIRKIDQPDVTTDGVAQTESTAQTQTEAPASQNTESVTQAVEDAPSVGIYHMTYCDFGTKEVYELQTDFQDDSSLGRDLCVFAVFPSQKAELSGQYFKYIWEDAVSDNPESSGMKVGYLLEYSTPVGDYSRIILRPADITEEYWDFLEVYIYDDVNQDVTAWHSHLLDEEITDETLVTSFKITAGERIGEVSDITLTAFLYRADNADSVDMKYIEHNGYTVNVAWDPARVK